MRIFKTPNGKEIVYLNPSEKGKRYAEQLKTGQVKETGTFLLEKDKAFRKGYLAAQSDSADAYNAKHNPAKLAEKRAKRKVYFSSKKNKK